MRNLAMLFIMLTCFITPALVDAVTYSTGFDIDDLELTTVNGQYTDVHIDGLSAMGAEGSPQLPARVINLIIPSTQDVASLTITTQTTTVSGTHLVYPVQPEVELSTEWQPGPFVDPDPAIYATNDIYPAQAAEVLQDSYLDGANHIVQIALYPVRYLPLSQQLIFTNNITIALNFTTAGQQPIYPQVRFPRDAETYQNLLNFVVDNPQDIPNYSHQPTIIDAPRDDDDYNYVIIAPNELLPYFSDFIEWKEKKGSIVYAESYEQILSDYPNGDQVIPGGMGIPDQAGSIRQYLYEQYTNHGLSYVLLVGDETNAPIRKGSLLNNNPDYETSADLYFADFTGNWNVDSDLFYGEPADDVDYHQELFVGRLLIPSLSDGGAAEIANWTEKLLVYEKDPGYGDNGYLTSFFISDADGVYNSGSPPRLGDLMSGWGFDVEIIHESQTTLWPTGAYSVEKMIGKGITGGDCHWMSLSSIIKLPPIR